MNDSRMVSRATGAGVKPHRTKGNTVTRFNPFPRVSSSRGAPMGRHDTSSNFAAFDGVPLARLCARHCGGDGQYDRGGAYWGHSRVFAVWERGKGENGVAYVEASSAGQALRIVSEALAPAD